MSANGKLRILESGKYAAFCPGCKEYHIYDSRWAFDGNFDAPTFNPSMCVNCDPDTAHPDPEFNMPPARCHSFLTSGVWHFLGDSTHLLANKSVPARDEPVEWDWEDGY